MAFISERITEEDAVYFNAFAFKDVVGNPLKAYWWAVDKERNMFLFPRGGGSFDIPICFGFYWDGDLIDIEVIKNVKGSRYKNNLEIYWVIKKIIISKQVEEKVDHYNDILNLIEQAFMGLGTTGIGYDKMTKINVDNQSQIVVKE